MNIRPILSTLLRHKTASILIVLEIALSCAIICNAVFLISGRIDRIERPTGMAEDELVVVRMAGFGRDDNAQAQAREDLAALRALPGVKAATRTNQIPFAGSSWNSGIRLTREQRDSTANATVYMAEEGFLDTFGLELVQGRYFNPDEYLDWEDFNEPGADLQVPAVIITRSLADRLFPEGDAVGQSLYNYGDEPHRVVGVVERLIRPNDQGGAAEAYYSTIFPLRYPFRDTVLRTDPEDRAEVMDAAIAELKRLNPRRVLTFNDMFSQVIHNWYQSDRAMAWMMVMVIVALLVVTALGIIGLASFWVAQRTKQIGVRRALGATRGQVLRYFQTENFLLTTVGIVLGMIGAYGINQLLMSHYEFARLPGVYLPLGAAALWLLGQFAVFGPARRASAVPPAVATRSV